MDEPRITVDALQDRVVGLRRRAMDANKALIGELSGLWREVNLLRPDDQRAQELREMLAADIARLEKLDLEFDTEWLAQDKRERR